MNRREWLSTIGAMAPALAVAPRAADEAPPQAPAVLELKDFQPRSMLQVPATRVPRAKFPVIDFHTHLGFSAKGVAGVPHGEERRFAATPAELLPVMDRVNLRTMVNLTGGTGSGLRESISRFQEAHPGRFITFTEPQWDRSNQPGYPREQAEAIERAHKMGAR